MTRTKSRVALATTLACATIVWTDEATVMRKLSQAAPHLNVASVSASPVRGIHEIEIKEDLSRLYITRDGNYLFRGMCMPSPLVAWSISPRSVARSNGESR